MTGRVLSEEQLESLNAWLAEVRFIHTDYAIQVITNLIDTIRDRDKTITHLKNGVSAYKNASDALNEQNTILREALEQVQWYKDGTGWMRCPVCGWTQDAGHGTDCAIGEALAKVGKSK